MNEVYRKEKKYLLDIMEYTKYSQIFENIMKKDIHNGTNGYKIRTLYFDTINDKDYEEKEEGLRNRRKIRLRIYNATPDFGVIELKQKDGEFYLKKSLKINKEDAIAIIKGKYSVLLKYKDKFATECYSIMQMYAYVPKTVVEYTRNAFVVQENQTRITFDHSIKFSETNYNIFDSNLVLNNAIDSSKIVLEVKYSGFLLTYIKDLLKKIDKSEIAASKYCMGRKITKYYQYMY